MPHLFSNRPRLYDLTRGQSDSKAQFRWETINAILYKIGGLVFIAGSVLFFPRFEAYANWGAWTFFFGSLLYLIVTGHDIAEAIRYRLTLARPTRASSLELVAAGAYLFGTILFTVGSILFLSQVGLVKAGAWCFVVGSLLFVLGACINVLQILVAKSIDTLQLMNFTALCFVVGAVLFTVASVPYLWSVAPADRELLDGFLAWQYLIGSCLFFMGGVFNYWRAYLVIKRQLSAQTSS